MKIDSRNFPPIAILGREGERFSVSMPDVMMKNRFEPNEFYKMLDGLVEGARPNVLTSTKEADNLMTHYNKDCIESYLADSNKKTFSGAYLDMSMSVPSMDLFHIMPLRRTNDCTGAIEDVIACLLMSIQSNDNIVVSYGAITYKNYHKGKFEVEPALNCVNNEECDRSIDYMMYLLELNCFLEYAPEDAKNVIMVFGNQKVSLPGLGGFENRTHLIINVYVPHRQTNNNNPDKNFFFIMTRLPVLSLLVLMVLTAFTSCEDYYDDYECTCPHGAVIDGWDEPDDTTTVNQKDTTGGFDISVEKWENPETHDIHL